MSIKDLTSAESIVQAPYNQRIDIVNTIKVDGFDVVGLTVGTTYEVETDDRH